MVRTLACAALALVLAAGSAFAADAAKEKKKKGSATAGTVKKFDAGTLTVSVKDKATKSTVDKEFKLTDSVKFLTFVAGEKKPKVLSATDAKSELKEGAAVTVIADDAGKVLAVRIGKRQK